MCRPQNKCGDLQGLCPEFLVCHKNNPSKVCYTPHMRVLVGNDKYSTLRRFFIVEGSMKRSGYTARSIEIPTWMYVALVDLAGKHKRSVNGEIQYIIELGFEAMGIEVPAGKTATGDRVTEPERVRVTA